MEPVAEIPEKEATGFLCVFLKKIIRKLFQRDSEKPPTTEWNFWQ